MRSQYSDTDAKSLDPTERSAFTPLTFLGSARFLFLLFVFSLPFMHHSVRIDGLDAVASDLLFLLGATAFALALLTRQARLKWHGFFWVIGLYFAAMSLSLLAADSLGRSVLKLATNVYLLSLPVLAYNLVPSLDDMRRVFRWWLAGAGIVGLVGTMTVLLFYVGVDPKQLAYSVHEYGTLPPGPYTRIQATFLYPALLTNYLTVSLMLLLAARRLGWLGVPAYSFLLLMGGVTAAFSLTPGLGGIVLGLGVWWWLSHREPAPLIARLGLFLGIAGALLFVLVATVTPILHSTAPFLIAIPGFEQPLAPSVRMLTWIASVQNLMEYPLLGRGIGETGLAVHYVGPGGAHHVQTDAHNVYLNIAVQCGFIGVAALLVLIWRVARETRPLKFPDTAAGTLRVALGTAWLNAFAYQGLTGSYEDARWLWVVLGLLLAANHGLEQAKALPPR